MPNGDPLPAVPGGELPHLAVQNTSKVNFYAYGNVKYFALFVPTPGLNPFVNLTFPINNAAGTKTLGYLATVAQKVTGSTTFDGGFYLAMVFPPELAAILDDLFG